MSYPSRPGIGMPGMPPMGMSFMGMSGVPPPGMQMGMPPNMLSGPPPGPNPFFGIGTPPPRSTMTAPPNHGQNRPNSSHVITGKSTVQLPADHPSPIPMKVVHMGPPVTVFVGNITEKWPDAMIRQLLATCGHVMNWKRVQGASGKLQGFGFCEFNGPDSGLRAVRLLHDIEVGDKKLVVKVDAKTSTVLEEYKAERKKKKAEDDQDETEESKQQNKELAKGEEDYLDQEMKELDERSRMRISILFREFKNELESYVPPGNEKPEKDPGSKQAIQDKLHLLKLTSLDAPPSDADASDDIAVEEGKREIITQEISKFREHMKQEKEKEEERKRLGRERRERQKEREEREKSRREREGGSKSPSSRRRDRGRSRSPTKRVSPNRSPSRGNNRSRSRSKPNENFRNRADRDNRGRRDRDRTDTGRDRDRDRNQPDRERGNRERRRSRDRSPVSRFRASRDRDRSPMIAPHKRRYREREEEEEAEEQRRQEKRAREKEEAYDAKLRRWEEREVKKARDRIKEKERQERTADEVVRDARKMKQFLEDYDDEKMDPKYYKGKELQKRLSDRAKELEVDNKDRQREREEIEEMRLKVLTGGGGVSSLSGTIPVITLDRTYKKPMMDSTNTSLSSSPSQFQSLSTKLNKSPVASTGSSVAARLLAIAGQIPNQPTNQSQTTTPNNGVQTFSRRPVTDKPGPVHRPPKTPPPPPKIEYDTEEITELNQQPQTGFNSIQFSSFVPMKNRSSNPSTPNSDSSPAVAPELSPSLKSLANTGFQLNMNNNSNASSSLKAEEDDTRHSFSSANSPGMSSPNYGQDDDSSLQDMSPDFGKKKKMDIKDIFNQDEDDDGLGSARKRTLVPLDYGDSKLKKEEKVLEDKKKHVKSLIDRIPTEKDSLFAYEIDWTMVDTTLMEKRIRPWINKKIIEYIGEPEPTLVEFICTKVLARSEPTGILEDVQMVLDEEAEVFVVKMWRLLIYEIEAKKIGIASAIKAN